MASEDKSSPSHVRMSRITFGTMRMTEWGAKMTWKEADLLLRKCLSVGITTLDTADIYGNYTVESLLGEVFERDPKLREQFQIVTKCGIRLVCPQRPQHKVKTYDSSKEHILESVKNSLACLKTSYVDVLLLHRLDPLADPDEIAEAFSILKKEGLVHHFGVSNYSASQFQLLQSRLPKDIPLCANQIQVNLLHTEALTDGTLDICQQYNVLPMAWSPLAGGVLMKSHDERSTRIRNILKEIGAAHDHATVDQMAIAWLLAHPSKMIIVYGTSDLDRLESASKATQIKLTREEWFRILEASTGREVP